MDDRVRKVQIGSAEIQTTIVGLIKRLARAVLIEKTCSKKDAAADVVYFLKQMIFILEQEK